MKLSSNFINFYDVLGLEKTIDLFSEVGFEAIDFNLDKEPYYADTLDQDFFKSITAYAADKGIAFTQTHAPFPSGFPEEESNQRRFAEIVTAIKHASWLGAKMIVVHPTKHIDYKENYDAALAWNLDFYRRLIPYAEEFGIQIAIENIRGTLTETPQGLLTLLQLLDDPVFTVCCDVGHANICGVDPVDLIRQLGSRIGCTHIHDNDGTRDAHTLPYCGTIDWERVMQAFAEIGYEGNLNYEAGRFLTNVPAELRDESARYMAAVGKHLIQRYWHYRH